MKKINSINYGAKVIGIGLVFMILVPAILLICNEAVEADMLCIAAIVSATIGILIEIVFVIILMIELRQDKIINKYYTKNPQSKKTPQQILNKDI